MYSHDFENSKGKENIVDPSLERIDPTPSIHVLFCLFNKRYFWNKLNMVEVSWSGRQMTSCAGLCAFHPRTGYCNIRLSAPLLSLRPRKDLVETLLHEMIHAYLFMTHNFKDRNDHGPEFHKHMYRINQEAGTNITVYHTFNDEVRHYQSHVWRCDGPCQKMGPFYGLVRRATNRAPGPNDQWWESHRNKCSGVFEKIEEPPGYKSKKKSEKKVPANDLRNFFPVVNNPRTGANIHTFGDKSSNDSRGLGGGLLKNKGAGTVVVAGKPKSSQIDQSASSSKTTFSPVSKVAGGSNIFTFDDLNSAVKRNVSGGNPKNLGKGVVFTTGLSSQSGQLARPFKNPHTPSATISGSSVNQQVRNVWAEKYHEKTCTGPGKRKITEPIDGDGKSLVVECPDCGDLMEHHTLPSHRETCAVKLPCPVCGTPVKGGCLEQHLALCLSDSITEDIFATEVPQPGNQNGNSGETEGSDQTVACPVCAIAILEREINSHLDECLNITVL